MHTVLPDRIEFGTLACAAAATDGARAAARPHRAARRRRALFEAAGIALHETPDGVVAGRAPDGLRGIDITTGPYPGIRHRPAGADHGAC